MMVSQQCVSTAVMMDYQYVLVTLALRFHVERGEATHTVIN